MADKFLGSVSNSGEYIAGFFSGSLSGSTSTPVTISCPSGKRLRLESLITEGNNAGFSVSVGVNTVVDDKTLTDNELNITNSFSVGQFATGKFIAARSIPFIQGGVDEDIVISCTSDYTIYYSYSYGD